MSARIINGNDRHESLCKSKFSDVRNASKSKEVPSFLLRSHAPLLVITVSPIILGIGAPNFSTVPETDGSDGARDIVRKSLSNYNPAGRPPAHNKSETKKKNVKKEKRNVPMALSFSLSFSCIGRRSTVGSAALAAHPGTDEKR